MMETFELIVTLWVSPSCRGWWRERIQLICFNCGQVLLRSMEFHVPVLASVFSVVVVVLIGSPLASVTTLDAAFVVLVVVLVGTPALLPMSRMDAAIVCSVVVLVVGPFSTLDAAVLGDDFAGGSFSSPLSQLLAIRGPQKQGQQTD